MLKVKDGAARRLHIIVKGTVQGVGFRWFVRKTARHLDVSGWVRNLTDGSVEIEAEQSPQILEAFQRTLKSGHPWAGVDDIIVEPVPPAEEKEPQFQIIE